MKMILFVKYHFDLIQRIKKRKLHIFLTGLLFITSLYSTSQTVRYVKPVASGSGNGSSWANASNNLQMMINASANGDQVWVAAGTYKPTSGADRTISFSMKNGVGIYGGFNGTETLLSQRNFISNLTRLSGDLNGDDIVNSATNILNNGENSFQVVANRFTFSNPLLSTAVLDGFTITGGNTDLTTIGNYNSGGGMYNLFASPTLNNIIFFGNSAFYGGGGLLNSLNCSPILTNVTFLKNFSSNNGGGMYNYKGANTILTNVTFKDNFSFGSGGGGGIYNYENKPSFTNCYFDNNFAQSAGAFTLLSSPASFTNCSFTNSGSFQAAGTSYIEQSLVTFKNCLFSGGRAGLYGGAIVNVSSEIDLLNCTFFDNRAGINSNSNPYIQSGVMDIYSNGSGITPVTNIRNCILWGNQSLFLTFSNQYRPSITYSIVQGGWSGPNNSSSNPLFVNSTSPAGPDNIYGTTDDGLRLQDCSPAINAGNNMDVTSTDFTGNPRIMSGIVDLGSYESQSSLVAANAGPDRNICGVTSVTLAGNTPIIGTGLWSIVSGSGGSFDNPGNPLSTFTGVSGTNYTLRWTITSPPCASSFDDVVIAFLSTPDSFALNGGNVTVCKGTIVTLNGPAIPNHIYEWEKSLTGTTIPYTFSSFGGTSSSQTVTTSGIYRLTVRNQLGCSSSDTVAIKIADYSFNGSLGPGDAQQTGIMNRFGSASSCILPNLFPGYETLTGARYVDSYTVTNLQNTPVCATIGLSSECGANISSAAYLENFNPADISANYLGHQGTSVAGTSFYEVTIPANKSIVVVVYSLYENTGCSAYQLTVDVPRDLSAVTATPQLVPYNSTSVLNAPAANTYLWSPGGGTAQSVTTLPVTASGNYYVTLGYGNYGCARLDSVAINVICAPPTITCPGDVISNNAAGQCGSNITYSTPITGSSPYTVTYHSSGATSLAGSGNGSGSFFNRGVTYVTVIAANECGTDSCSFTITVNDTEPPVVTTGTIDSCYATVAAAEAAALAATTTNDNCQGTLTTTVSTSGTCSAVITVTVTDTALNSTSVTYTTKIDNIPPIALCRNVTIYLNAGGTATVTAAQVDNGSSDNCGLANLSVAPFLFTCASLGANTVTLTATDLCGNTSTCTANVTVADTTRPILTAGSIASCYPTVAAAQAAAISATAATDNCQGGLLKTASTTGTCNAIITVTVIDASGNTAYITYTTRIDNTPPIVTTGTIASCYSNAAAAEAAAIIATTATDNCSGLLTETATTVGTCNAVITVITTDECGNETAVTYNTKIDNTAPVITCTSITVNCVADVPVPNVAAINVSDNCSGTITVTHVSDVISNQTCANRYTITRTYRATDVCGNFTECTQIITVNDQTPPTLTCPAPVTVSCTANVPVPDIAAVSGVSDNCGGAVTVTHVSDVISNQICANRYTITRTYRATDVCGNFTECTQIITVDDQKAPVITFCPANLSVTAVGSCNAIVNYPDAIATDNCGDAVTITYSKPSGSFFTVGTTMVTVTATDVCGNASTCTFNVTVIDGQVPAITTAPANTAACVGTNTIFTVTATNAVSYQWQIFTGGSWVNITGATGSSLALNNVTLNMSGNSYRVNVIGLCTTTSSVAASLTVNPLPTVTLTSSIPPLLVPGRILKISAISSPEGGTFVWLKNNGIIANETNATLSPVMIDGLGSYRVRYTDPKGCIIISDELVVGADKSDRLFIYPNPNNGRFQVRFYEEKPQVVTINVYDQGGKIIYQNKTFITGPYSQLEVDLGAGTRGTYIVEVLKGTNGERVGAKQILVTLF